MQEDLTFYQLPPDLQQKFRWTVNAEEWLDNNVDIRDRLIESLARSEEHDHEGHVKYVKHVLMKYMGWNVWHESVYGYESMRILARLYTIFYAYLDTE